MSFARYIIEGRNDLPEDMDQATKMIIEDAIEITQGNTRKLNDKPEISI